MCVYKRCNSSKNNSKRQLFDLHVKFWPSRSYSEHGVPETCELTFYLILGCLLAESKQTTA